MNKKVLAYQMRTVPAQSKAIALKAIELEEQGRPNEELVLASGRTMPAWRICHILHLDSAMTLEQMEDLKYDEPNDEG